MFERNQPTIPFVNLHAHDVAGSPFDALGYAPEHMDFAYQNGLTAHAITNHGNMNHLPNQILESATIAAIDISRQSAQQMIGLLENNVQTQKALG